MSALETFKAGELFQIAFIVRDLDAALERYSAMLGAGPWHCWTLHAENHTEEQYMGGPTDYVTRLALTSGDEIQLELVQPVKGPSIHADWLNEHGEGFHHLGYIVNSVADTIAEMPRPVVRSSRAAPASATRRTACTRTSTPPRARHDRGGPRAAHADARPGVRPRRLAASGRHGG